MLFGGGILGRGHLILAACAKARVARNIAASRLECLQSRIARFTCSADSITPFSRLFFSSFLVVAAVAGLYLAPQLFSHLAPTPQSGPVSEVTQAESDPLAAANPRLGGEEYRWAQLWAAPPTSEALTRLSQPSRMASVTEGPPGVPTIVADADRLAPSARSGEREEPTPTPTRTRQLTFEEQFIAQIGPAASESQTETRVPASVTIAQAILESDWGRSGLARNGNNFFGIKAKEKGGNAGVIWMNTGEVLNGQSVVVNAPFRAYRSAADSFIDHGKFFLENSRYASAMKVAGNATAFAREIQRAGYATDPAYADKLIRLMDKFSLYQYDSR